MKHLIIVILSALLVSTVFAVVVTKVENEADRIANGNTATLDKTYFFASITVSGQHVCGGLIYKQQWIITAASCVYGRSPSEILVTVGSTSLNGTEETKQRINVYKIYNFDTPYNPATKLHDIALLELTREMIIGDGVVSYIPFDELDLNLKGTIAGFGAQEVGGSTSNELLTADVTLLASADCPGPNFNLAYMYCAGTATDAGAGPCTFDEGSPMIQDQSSIGFGKTVAIGIVSDIGTCGNSTRPSAIYTRLSSYYAWIQNTAGRQPIINPNI